MIQLKVLYDEMYQSDHEVMQEYPRICPKHRTSERKSFSLSLLYTLVTFSPILYTDSEQNHSIH